MNPGPKAVCLAVLVLAGWPGPSRGQAASVFLDHVYVVVDSAAYAAMSGSAFLEEEFALFGERSNATGERTWRALGVGGEHTYIEIFPEGAGYGPAGASGVAFSVGRAGDLEHYERLLSRLPGRTVHMTRRSGVMGGREMPWFRSLRVRREGLAVEPSVSRWLMEYEAPFRRALLGDSADAVTGAGLRRGLRARRYDGDRLFRDISSVVIAMDAADARDLRAELETYGYSLTGGDAGGYRAHGPDIEITVVIQTHDRGIKELHLEVDGRAAASRHHSFGARSSLELLGGTAAVWRFR